MLRYKLLTFDSNNTLIRMRYPVGEFYRMVAKQFGVDVKKLDLNREFRTVFKDQVKRHPNYGITTGLTSEEWWTSVVHQTFERTGNKCDMNTLNKISSKLFVDYGTNRTWEPYPEVKEMLTFFNRNGVALGVLSNQDERLISILRSLDLASHFAFILPSNQVAVEKPDPAFFQMALERLQLEPPMAAHIGDHVELDYQAARAVGMDAFILDREGTLSEKRPEINQSHIISGISDLETLIFQQ